MLRRRGLKVLHLGMEVPVERLNQALEDTRPAALVLSAQMLTSAAALRDAAQALLERGVTVGYGGRIFNLVPEIRDHIPAYFLGETLEAALPNIEMLFDQNLPSAKALPVDETLADVRDGLVRAGDAIAFQVKQHMVALGVPATTMDTALAFAHRGLLAVLSLGNLDFMKADIAWVQGLLQHHGMDPTLLNAFWHAYQRAILEHLDTTVVQGYLVGKLTEGFRDDLLISLAVVVMAFSLLGWAWAPSAGWLLVILAPVAASGGLLNTLLSSALTKAVHWDEVGGILGLGASLDSATRIVAPIIGGVLIERLGPAGPGLFGAAIMAGLSLFVWKVIWNHPIAAGIAAKARSAA